VTIARYKSRDNWFIVLVIAIFTIVFVSGGIQLHDAIECGNKGGLYVTAKGMWPACLDVEVIK
jgi:hypothetical protein